MHELRKDPLLSRWVAVTSGSKSPDDYPVHPDNTEDGSCVLCSGREKETPFEIEAAREGNKWWARVVPNFKPILQVEGDLGRRGIGMYDRMNSVGANEIIIESPDHKKLPEDIGAEQMSRIIRIYRNRVADLEKDGRLRYILIYKNSGKEAGELCSHPHSEVMATPVIPKLIKEELDGAKQYYAYKERCIFCDMMREEFRIGDRLISETRDFVSFCPFAPKFPFEFWILPKRHGCAFQDIGDGEIGDLGHMLTTVLKKMRRVLKNSPYNYVIHTAPNRIPRRNHWHTLGDDFHWHIEVIPRLIRTSGFELGSDFYVLTTSPEDAAKYLREA
ncbi:MAG TPA: HIT domain-containing protein [Thermodesulfovibrionales bacterium]|nr:HIT domain-containing protein [Thermodesulfovibrionales bacterium]